MEAIKQRFLYRVLAKRVPECIFDGGTMKERRAQLIKKSLLIKPVNAVIFFGNKGQGDT